MKATDRYAQLRQAPPPPMSRTRRTSESDEESSTSGFQTDDGTQTPNRTGWERETIEEATDEGELAGVALDTPLGQTVNQLLQISKNLVKTLTYSTTPPMRAGTRTDELITADAMKEYISWLALC